MPWGKAQDPEGGDALRWLLAARQLPLLVDQAGSLVGGKGEAQHMWEELCGRAPGCSVTSRGPGHFSFGGSLPP